MSFVKFKKCIERGDTVILYLSVNCKLPITVEPIITSKKGNLVDHVLQTVYGSLRVQDLIGMKYGSKVKLSRGWGFVLAPTCDLWTGSLPHRTQILYSPDISMVLMQLQIKPGVVVIEAGTGSGSLSHALLRSVKPTGTLLTFDFHEERANIARKEFESHGYISPVVKVFHRDVCKFGFDGDEKDPIGTESVDSVFLDLPHPWLAIPHTRKVLKKGGRIATFSPCIEQVLRTKEALIENKFFEIETYEGLSKELQVQYRTHPRLALSADTPAVDNTKYLTSIPAATVPGHTGFLTFATLKPI